jgi:methylmalonyl-CoA mutase N-terminal domain/subunit
VEKGYPQREIAKSSYDFERQLNQGERVMVGVNKYVQAEPDRIPTLRIDEEVQRRQVENLAKVKAGRSRIELDQALASVRDAAKNARNLMPPIIAAARAYATEQEICDVLREVFGTYSDPAEF